MCMKQNKQHCNKYCVPEEKKSCLSSLIFLSIYVYLYVPTNAHLYMYIFLYINAFFLCTNMFAKHVKHPQNIQWRQRKQKWKCTRKKQKDIKRRITNAAHSDRSKLKRRVRMRRCLFVERVGENGSSIGVPDCKI